MNEVSLGHIALVFSVAILAWVNALIVPPVQAQAATGAATLSFATGWNLVGMGSSGSLDAATTFGDATQVNTVWKWVPLKSKWAFYAPSLDGQQLTNHAAVKGYDVLTTIHGGEGFWVNAKAAFTAPSPPGTLLTSVSFRSTLLPGWNLIATGDNPTPSQFNQALSATPPQEGMIPENLTTLWTWDPLNANWYFYAPNLESAGGAALSDYITSKGYLEFGTKVLDPGLGFWVNVPATTYSSPAASWTFDGAVLSTNGSDFGGVQGPLADVTVLPLRDGRYRMFIGGLPVTPVTPDGIHSAISSDGVRFTLESGPRVVRPYPNPLTTMPGPSTFMFAAPHAVRLDDGRVRLFVSGGGGISSLTSSDEGMTFTLDPGPRISAADVGVKVLAGASIVKMKTGGWRMYFSDMNLASVDPATGRTTLGADRVFSAFSTDLLTWTIDPGLRAGPGSAIADAASAGHPASIANDDGSVTLIYFDNLHRTLMASTSTDGLNFTSEVATPFSLGSTPGPAIHTWSTIGPGADPFLMRLNTGEVRIYYDWGNDTAGTIYTARHVPFSASTSP